MQPKSIDVMFNTVIKARKISIKVQCQNRIKLEYYSDKKITHLLCFRPINQFYLSDRDKLQQFGWAPLKSLNSNLGTLKIKIWHP